MLNTDSCFDASRALDTSLQRVSDVSPMTHFKQRPTVSWFHHYAVDLHDSAVCRLRPYVSALHNITRSIQHNGRCFNLLVVQFYKTVARTMVEIVLSLFVAIVLAGFIKTLIQNLLLRHKLRKIPGWKGLPLVGCTLEMKPDPVGE